MDISNWIVMINILHIQYIITNYKFYNFKNKIYLDLLFNYLNICLLHIFSNFVNIWQQRYQEVKTNSSWQLNYNCQTFNKPQIQITFL